MTSRTSSYILKFSLTLLSILPCMLIQAQVDLKNALPDLNIKYAKAPGDREKIKLALTLSNFYLSNKAPISVNLDTSLSYAKTAENLSSTISYNQGIEDARVIMIRLLLVQNKLSEAQEMANKATGSLYCRLHIAIGKFFLEKGGEEKSDLDIADKHLTAAQNYAATHHMPILSLLALTYRYPLQMEQYLAPRIYEKTFAQIISDSKKHNQKGIEARIWYTKAANENNDSVALTYYKKAVGIAYAAQDTDMAIREMKEIADLNFRAGKLDTAEKQLKNVLKLYAATGYKNVQYTYDLLSAVYMAKVNFEAAMRNSLNAAKCAEATGTDYNLNYIQFRLANICRDMGLKKRKY